MWLLENQKAQDHATIVRFRTGRCREAIEDPFYQYVRKLEKMGEMDHRFVFIDETKLKSRVGRYIFVWRKSVEKLLVKGKKQELRSTGRISAELLCAWLEESAQRICVVHGSNKRNSYSKTDQDATFMRLKEVICATGN